MGASQVISNRAPRIWFGLANLVGPEKGRYSSGIRDPRSSEFIESHVAQFDKSQELVY